MSKPYPLIDGKKRCPKCREYKELDEYHKDKNKPYGVVACCKKCVKEKHARFYINNKIKVNAKNKEWRNNNKDKTSVINHKYYLLNKDKINERAVKWRINNPEKANASIVKWRESNRQKQRQATKDWKERNPDKMRDLKRRQYERYKQDISFVIASRVSNALRYSLKNSDTKAKANRKWEDIVEFTIDQLKEHLESQFTPEMSWDNYGSYWHIDHIVPIAAFNFENPEDVDFKRCWRLENLQPLEAHANMSKGAKIDKPFQPSLAIAV